MLELTAWITRNTTHWGLEVESFFWAAILGAIVVSIVGWILDITLKKTRGAEPTDDSDLRNSEPGRGTWSSGLLCPHLPKEPHDHASPCPRSASASDRGTARRMWRRRSERWRAAQGHGHRYR